MLTGALRPADVQQLFDRIPEVVFFIKDRAGRYTVVNRTLVERLGARSARELLGRRAADFFPADLARTYTAQDEEVIRTGRPIFDRLELHWHRRGKVGWCLTTKIPLRDEAGTIVGLVGSSRDLRAPGDKSEIPSGLVDALEHLERHFAEPLTPAQLAAIAGLKGPRFARCIRRIFQLSPIQLIIQTRLNAATRLLRETDRSIAEIALDCGFYDHSAFTQAFRSVTGVTPSNFRLLEKGASSPS